jgi:hypothetical protein
MALDIAVLGADGAPEHQVSLFPDDHCSLLRAANPREAFPLIQRLDNYYGDATFLPADVVALELELRRIASGAHDALIGELLTLCKIARVTGRSIEVLAD